jgi:hypothetical protein
MVEPFKPAAIKPLVSPADLDKLDIRLGTIELVEDVRRQTSWCGCGWISAITSAASWSG